MPETITNAEVEKFGMDLLQKHGLIKGSRIMEQLGKTISVLDSAPEDIKDDVFFVILEVLQKVRDATK